uniref:Uncharacterized protein n=1 Tax=Candidatus Kentrum sp. LFY TaxID=2126342 RepID=A0A450UG13_9GAMM|nr:MAG: hypothetical protein BECKLFY1418B_GA0070995_101031 [Candidatus Kentron sp. LFY]VFJ91501.1 MAG: hypothetical protein BECKLFY1418A_GA0070994_101627 [Candidatus Kentron sp. LFY]
MVEWDAEKVGPLLKYKEIIFRQTFCLFVMRKASEISLLRHIESFMSRRIDCSESWNAISLQSSHATSNTSSILEYSTNVNPKARNSLIISPKYPFSPADKGQSKTEILE